jgi:hypothetical protein
MKPKTIKDLIADITLDVELFKQKVAQFEQDYELLQEKIVEYRLSLAVSMETLKQLKTLVPGETNELVKNNPCDMPRCIYNVGQLGPCACTRYNSTR